MVNIEYKNAYSEVLEILKYISEKDYNKIPKEKIDIFKSNANKEYIVKYDPNKTLDEQNISKIAQGIIAILYRDYWTSKEKRDKILSLEKEYKYYHEEEKKKKYNSEIIFENNTKRVENTEISIVKKENFIQKIRKFFKSLFKNKMV